MVHLLDRFPRETKMLCPQNELYKNVNRSFANSSPKLEEAQVSSNEIWIKKFAAVLKIKSHIATKRKMLCFLE